MSCYSNNTSSLSFYSTNDSDCAEQPRDFSLIDSSPDSSCSPPPPPLPLPRMSKVKSVQADGPRVDGACTRREIPAPQEPKDPHKFYREVVDRLALHIARSQGATFDSDGFRYSTTSRRRPLICTKDTINQATLNQGGREALNSHYEQWTFDVSAARATAAKTRRAPLPVITSATLPASVRSQPVHMYPVRPEPKIRTIVKYVEYDTYGNRKDSKYIVKMPRGAVTLREFKKVMPHTVMRPRFFFSTRVNESMELEDDSARLPTITSEEGEPINVAEITSRPI